VFLFIIIIQPGVVSGFFQASAEMPFEAYIAYVTVPYLMLCRVLFVSVGTQAWALPGQYHT
jgi:hypothetical protein